MRNFSMVTELILRNKPPWLPWFFSISTAPWCDARVRTTGEALVDAVRQVTGVETTTEGIPVHGMLDPDILTRMMLAGGL